MHKVRFQEAASMTENIIGMVINIQLQSKRKKRRSSNPSYNHNDRGRFLSKL